MSIPPRKTPGGLPRHAVKSALLISTAVHGLLLFGFALVNTRTRAAMPLLDCKVVAPEGSFLLSLDAPGAGGLSDGGIVPIHVNQGPLSPIAAGPGPVVDTTAMAGVKPAGGPPGQGAGGPGGKGASFFQVPIRGRSVVYVVDRSLSMLGGALGTARAALLASLEVLPPNASFQVVFYNTAAEPLRLGRSEGLLPADPNMLSRAAAVIRAVRPAGNTDHARALRCGLALHPDVLFLVTDADDLSPSQVRATTRINRGRSVIHAVCVGRRHTAAALEQLAQANGGICFCPGP